jgi:hypothetical protein
MVHDVRVMNFELVKTEKKANEHVLLYGRSVFFPFILPTFLLVVIVISFYI